MKRSTKCILSILVILSLIILLFGSYLDIFTVAPLMHQMHGKLTGQDAIIDSTAFGVGGTDLGIIVKHNGQFLYFFGDTFSSTTSMTGNWRSNTLAISEDTDPSDGIALNSWIMDPTTGNAKDFISSLKVDYIEVTCIPTTVVSFNEILYVYYMSVIHWSETGGLWTCNNASLAFSEDGGQTFTKVSNISWAGDSNFIQFGVAQSYSDSDPFLYLLATPAGRFGSCYLSRVSPTSILNKTSYEYFTGMSLSSTPTWSNDEEDATPIFSAPVGEVSVMWNSFLEKWTVFYTDNEAFSIVLRTAENLWGSWSDAITIVDETEYPSLYGSFVHPDLVENNGETVYFIMSIFTQYNTYVMSVDLSSLAT